MVRAERLAGPYTAVSAVIVFGLLCFTPPAVALKHQASNSAFVLPGHGLLAQRELSKSSATYGSLQRIHSRSKPQPLSLRMSGGNAMSGGDAGALARVGTFAMNQMLPIGLLLAILVGTTCPSPGIWLSKQKITTFAASGIFFIGGLKLKTDEAKAALSSVKSVLWGVSSILFFTVLLGSFLNQLCPLSVPEFSLGIGIFMCMPCTINSGVGLAASAGGNFALALILTVICSTVSVFTVPMMLNWLLSMGSQSTAITLPVVEMMKKLCLTVLLPIALGKAISASGKPAKAAIKKHGSTLGIISNLLIIITPWMQISLSAAKGTFALVPPFDILAAVALTAGIHVAFLFINYLGSRLLGLTEEMVKSVVFVASSKTLPLALTVLAILPAGVGDKGLIALPCILGHFTQIVMDSFIASNWKSKAQN